MFSYLNDVLGHRETYPVGGLQLPHGTDSALIAGLDHAMFCKLKIDFWSRILVEVTIYRGLLIGRDGYLDQSEAHDIS